MDENGEPAKENWKESLKQLIYKQANHTSTPLHQKSESVARSKENLNKFIAFIEFHGFQPEDIWETQPCFAINQFANVILQKTGFKLTTAHMTVVAKICKNPLRIVPSDFNLVGLWQKSSSMFHTSKPAKSRPKSSNPYFTPKNSSIREKENIKSKQMQSPPKNYSLKSSLKVSKSGSVRWIPPHSEARTCYQSRVAKLDDTIKSNILEKKWDYLLKVSQLNKWLSDNQGQDIQYRINNLPEGMEIIRCQNEKEQIISENVFSNIYKKFEHGTHPISKKNNLKGTILMVLDEKDKVTKSNIQAKTNQRDQELNYLLLKIVRMKNIFQHQQKSLAEKMVNS